MLKRYAVSPGKSGWGVTDVWTGRAVLVDGKRQVGLDEEMAETLAHFLNWRARRGDRRVLQ